MPDAHPFAAIERAPRLSDRVADAILATIVSRERRPGDTLPSERELGRQFGVSRTVIREAVCTLSAKGLLTSKIGSGTKVIGVTPDGVSETVRRFLRRNRLAPDGVAEVRRVLELEAAGQAARRATEQDVATITARHEALSDCGHEPVALASADLGFHRSISTAAHNELFAVFHDSIADSLLESRVAGLGGQVGEPELSVIVARHAAIVAAIVARDPERAAAAMAADLDHVPARRHGGRSRRAPRAAAARVN